MVQIIGHRGARGLEPENTMRSFRKALELGVDYIECDVHMTKDGHIVLMHDHTVDRTTNASGPVNSFTFDEIRKLDAGEGEIIPTLGELLDLARGKVKLHIELKDETAPLQVTPPTPSPAPGLPTPGAPALPPGQTPQPQPTPERVSVSAPSGPYIPPQLTTCPNCSNIMTFSPDGSTFCIRCGYKPELKK